jgi:hypothetical protein
MNFVTPNKPGPLGGIHTLQDLVQVKVDFSTTCVSSVKKFEASQLLRVKYAFSRFSHTLSYRKIPIEVVW